MSSTPPTSGTVAAVSTDRALELLKDAGLSGYEGKAYLALLAAGEPLNGYEVAKASGVPRSTVYETLGKLVARGAAFEVTDAATAVSYVPLPADALIGRLRRQTHETIGGLESVLPTVGKAFQARVVQHLTGHDDVINRAIDVIESAARTLWLSVWPHESDEFVASVAMARAASARNPREYNEASAKYDMRVFLLHLGLSGEEFKNIRMHLLKRLPGSAAWKNGRPQA